MFFSVPSPEDTLVLEMPFPLCRVKDRPRDRDLCESFEVRDLTPSPPDLNLEARRYRL